MYEKYRNQKGKERYIIYLGFSSPVPVIVTTETITIVACLGQAISFYFWLWLGGDTTQRILDESCCLKSYFPNFSKCSTTSRPIPQKKNKDTILFQKNKRPTILLNISKYSIAIFSVQCLLKLSSLSSPSAISSVISKPTWLAKNGQPSLESLKILVSHVAHSSRCLAPKRHVVFASKEFLFLVVWANLGGIISHNF